MFDAITQITANGLRFEFEEICRDGMENNEILVFVPQLSIMKIKFKKQCNMPTVQFETPKDYYQDPTYGEFTPNSVINTKLSSDTRNMLELA